MPVNWDTAMNLRYDTAFYVRVLDKYVMARECTGANNEPLCAYLLSIMDNPVIKIQVLSDGLCTRIFYDTVG